MNDTNKTPERLTLYFSVLMAFAYIAGGIALLTSTQSYVFLPGPPLRYIFGGLLIVYGIFRGVRAYQRFSE